MATIKKFEDIDTWKKSRVLSKEIYKITMNGAFSKDFALRDQIRRSCGSVMDNIAEGFGRSGKGEFRQFLAIAKGSSAELRSQLYRALDLKYINQEKFEEIYALSDDISKMISGLIKYLNKTPIRGSKYK